jgi:phosphoglycolate phosphatase-like HAD superfamily hydrolase
MDVVFFGDAKADRDAAARAGCAFVAVVGETDQFPGTTAPKIADFVNDEVVFKAINGALVANST